MAELQPSKTKSLRVEKHRPRQTSCLVNAIHHKPSRKAITLYMCTLQPFPYRHKFVQSHWWQHQTFSSVYEPKHINMIKGRGNAGFRSSTLKLDSRIQGMLPQHSQFTYFKQMQWKLTRFQILSCIRSDTILPDWLATVAKLRHTNTTKQQKFKNMLKRLSMLQNLTKLSTRKQNLQLLFSLQNYKGAKDKDIIELKCT